MADKELIPRGIAKAAHKASIRNKTRNNSNPSIPSEPPPIVNPVTYYGVGGNGTVTQSNINAGKDIYKSYRSRNGWNEVEVSNNVFVFDKLDSQFNLCKANGLKLIYQILGGPNNTPNFMYDVLGVEKVYTDDDTFAFYPNYKNATYQAKFKNVVRKTIEHISTLDGWEDVIVGYFSAEGKTGDADPFAGTPTNSAYAWTDEDWFTWREDVWNTILTALADFGMDDVFFIFNPGNDGDGLDKGLEFDDLAWIKAGNIGHDIFWTGSKPIYDVYNAFDNGIIVEQEGVTRNAWFNGQVQFALSAHALQGSLKIMNIAPNNIKAKEAFYFFNQMVNCDDPTASDRAWLYPCDFIDLADITRFPVNTFGVVINPTSPHPTQYANAVSNADASGNSAMWIAWRKSGAKETHFNPARRTAIVASLASTGMLDPVDKSNFWLRDCGIDTVQLSLGRHMSIVNQLTCTIGQYRVGSGTQGRFCLKFKDTNVPVNIDFASTLALGANVHLKLFYFDKGVDTFTIGYRDAGGVKVTPSIICGNSLTWKVHEMDITGFVKNGLSGSHGLTLTAKNGTLPTFGTITVVTI